MAPVRVTRAPERRSPDWISERSESEVPANATERLATSDWSWSAGIDFSRPVADCSNSENCTGVVV